MLEQFFTFFKFAFRQRAAFLAALDLIKQFFTLKVPFTKIGATLFAIVELFNAAILDMPRTPRGPELDLSGYELVFRDEFDGGSVNTDVWDTRVGNGTYKLSDEQLSVKDGNLVITTEYKDGSMGEGWYTSGLSLKEDYCKGYFEIRCKVFDNLSRADFWSAFWLTCEGVYDADVSKGGVGGCKIDIFESFTEQEKTASEHPVGITPALWCNGVDDNPASIDGINFGQWYSNDPVNEFNTYGVLWTDDYYIWYINGVECFRINYGSGVSEVPETLRIDMCTPNIGPENVARSTSQPDTYTIDYVRIYQPAR